MAAKMASTPKHRPKDCKGHKGTKATVNSEDEDIEHISDDELVSDDDEQYPQESEDDTPEDQREEPGEDKQDASSWLYKGKRLPEAPYTIKDNFTDLEITSYYLDKLLKCKFNDSQRIVGDHIAKMSIYRLLRLKRIYKNNQHTLNMIEPIRQQQFSAIAGQLFADFYNGPHVPCKTCASSRFEGPFEKCIYDENGLFGGACANCQFKSSGNHCSIRRTMQDKKSTGKGKAVVKASKPKRPLSSSSKASSSSGSKRAMVTTPTKAHHSFQGQYSPSQNQYSQFGRPTTSKWIQQSTTESLSSLQGEISAELTWRVSTGNM